MRRRDFVKTISTLATAALLPTLGGDSAAQPQGAGKQTTPFMATDVQKQARELASKPFAPPKTELPKALQQWEYDQYRDIRFKRERALWATDGLPFQAEFFHRGFIFKEPVALSLVAEGQARPIAYTPDLFTFGPSVQAPAEGSLTDFSGFRLRAPISRPDYFDEFAVFQGASYFRAIAKNQGYGLSARGLALNTAEANGEEFPFFRAFWIERPLKESSVIVVHALLDSVSTAGAYRFTIRPGEATVMDVEMTLYPRVELPRIGLAPLTSMFYFAANDRAGIDDFRPAVHDSEGLAIWNGREEWLWRPLSNPETLQVSAFVDASPRGFGLLQRHRAFTDYQDLEARYERRPSVWVEPIGDWGQGAVLLIEIPSGSEYNDNIVAFWRPKQALPAQTEYHLTYRLHWCNTPPVAPSGAITAATRIGAGAEKGARNFVLDFSGGRLPELKEDAAVVPVITTSAGTIKNSVAYPNPAMGGWRVSFVLVLDNAPLYDLRCTLQRGQEILSEVWSYRWTL